MAEYMSSFTPVMPHTSIITLIFGLVFGSFRTMRAQPVYSNNNRGIVIYDLLPDLRFQNACV